MRRPQRACPAATVADFLTAILKSMTEEELEEFASTKHDDLPDKIDEDD